MFSNSLRFSSRCLSRCHFSERRSQLYRQLCFANENATQKCAAISSVNDALTIDPNENQRIGVKGWVQRVAKHKNTVFIRISDGLSSNNLQVVLDNDMLQQSGLDIGFGASIYCEGTIKESIGNEQRLELICDRIDIIGDSKNFSISSKQPDWVLRQKPHLRMRLPKFVSLLRIRSALTHFIHKSMNDELYVNITTPIITSSDCEGAGKVFSLKSPFCTEKETYFGIDTHLTVSAQMHLEASLGGFSKVYTLSPAFRAENSRSLRHVSEFTMLEVEEAFVDSLEKLMNKVEYLCKSMANHICEEHHKELESIMDNEHRNILNKLIKLKFIRVTYEEAIDIINKTQKISQLKYGDDIGRYHEKVLLDYFDSIPVFIIEFPFELKPFYMKRERNKTLCFDLICETGGEVCGGSIREESYNVLKDRVDAMSNPENFQWYLEMRKFGSVPHGGFGIGLDRYLQTITGIRNITDVIPFPRWAHHCNL